MDITSDMGPITAINLKDCQGESGACGVCEVCARRASVTVADLVIEWRYTRRGRGFPSSNAEEKRYAVNTVKRVLAALGLPGGGDPLCPSCANGHPYCALCLLGMRSSGENARAGTEPTAQSEPGPADAAQHDDRSAGKGSVDSNTETGLE